MEASFVVPNDATDDDIAVIEEANASFVKMRSAKVNQIDSAEYINSKLAWKLVTLCQPFLYRVVSLTESFVLNWNAKNIVGAYLPARALIETVSLLLELESDLRKHIADHDFSAIDFLVMNRLFATRDSKWVEVHPEAKAINILTLIDRLDRRDLPGIRVHYDEMSEVCHPNSLGHRIMYGRLDTKTGLTQYTNGWFKSHSLLATMVLVAIAKDAFDALNDRIDEIKVLPIEKR